MDGRRVIVTGATGFIGRELVRCLAREGAHVGALSRSESRSAPFRDLHGVEVIRFDSSAHASDQIANWCPDEVVHLATRFVARHGGARDALEMVDANVHFGAGVLEACTAAGASLISASTVWQHFEGRPYAPVSAYAATKQAFDDLAEYYALFEDLKWTRIVLGDTYGPWDDRGKLLTALLGAAASGRPLAMSRGNQLWDPVHVRDVVASIIGLLSRPSDERGQRWQLTSDSPLPIRQYVDQLSGVLGVEFPIVWGARPDRGREMLQPWLVAQRPPGWGPKEDFVEEIRRIWGEEFDPKTSQRRT